MINAIIVDDEPYCCEVLATLLQRYCPQVSLVACCTAGAEALEAIAEKKPGLVFLDVEMPNMNGFELLEQLPAINFDLIFTTSYDQYAIKAIRFSALDYLLKPIDREELQLAVQKITSRNHSSLSQQLEILLAKINHPVTPIHKIALPTMEGLQLVPVDAIICCTSHSNYTILLMKNRQTLMVSRTLKEVEALLEEHAFIRVHHSFVANLNEVDRYVKGEGGYLVMSDGSHVDVSRSKKEPLLKRLQAFKEK